MTLRLTAPQRIAVESKAKAIVVVAAAGSGKTEVLAQRLERLLSNETNMDGRVLALTYTVKAANELRNRLESRLGQLHRRVDADTMHGFALSLLRRYGTRIGLPPEPEVLTKDEDRIDLLLSWLDDSALSANFDPSTVMSKLDLARAQCADAPCLPAWRDALASRGALDYPAMLDRASELLELSWVGRQMRILYDHVVVDEAQNLSPAQYRLLKTLIGSPQHDHMDTVLVGDQRQSIVGFAGADSALIDCFQTEYSAERIVLNENFRSAEAIAELGFEVAADLNPDSRDAARPSVANQVEFSAAGSVEALIAESEAAEGMAVADWINRLINGGMPESVLALGESPVIRPEDVAVLSRSAGSLRFTRDALKKLGIDTATASTERDWVRSPAAQAVLALIAYGGAPDHLSTKRRISTIAGVEEEWEDAEQALSSSADRGVAAVAMLTRSNNPERLIAQLQDLDIEDADWLNDLAQFTEAWSDFVHEFGPNERQYGNFNQFILRRQKGDSLAPGVRLLTVHKSQGHEYKAVALVGCNEGQIPDFRATNREALLAEQRIFYVAVSRPTRMLLISRSLRRETRYGARKTEASRFLKFLRPVLGNQQ